MRNAPCINCQVCARGISLSDGEAFHKNGAVRHEVPSFRPVWAKKRENESFNSSAPTGNVGKSRVFRKSDR